MFTGLRSPYRSRKCANVVEHIETRGNEIPLPQIDNSDHMHSFQIFQPTDVETETMALHTTQVLIQTIYGGAGVDGVEDQEIEGLARDACDECIRILKEPEKSQAKPAMKVLCAFVSTTRK